MKRKYRVIAASEACLNDDNRWIIRYRVQMREWFKWIYLRKTVVNSTVSPNGVEYSEVLTPIAEFDSVEAAQRFVVNRGSINKNSEVDWNTVKEFVI